MVKGQWSSCCRRGTLAIGRDWARMGDVTSCGRRVEQLVRISRMQEGLELGGSKPGDGASGQQVRHNQGLSCMECSVAASLGLSLEMQAPRRKRKRTGTWAWFEHG